MQNVDVESRGAKPGPLSAAYQRGGVIPRWPKPVTLKELGQIQSLDRLSGQYDFPAHSEQLLRRVKEWTAREIYETITANLLAFGSPKCNVSFVVIKRH